MTHTCLKLNITTVCAHLWLKHTQYDKQNLHTGHMTNVCAYHKTNMAVCFSYTKLLGVIYINKNMNIAKEIMLKMLQLVVTSIRVWIHAVKDIFVG